MKPQPLIMEATVGQGWGAITTGGGGEDRAAVAGEIRMGRVKEDAHPFDTGGWIWLSIHQGFDARNIHACGRGHIAARVAIHEAGSSSDQIDVPLPSPTMVRRQNRELCWAAAAAREMNLRNGEELSSR
jgi:hypothetical protein